MSLSPLLHFLVAFCAGWVNRQQQDVIDYLRSENAVLRELLGDRIPRLNVSQRRRLAERAKLLGACRSMPQLSVSAPMMRA